MDIEDLDLTDFMFFIVSFVYVFGPLFTFTILHLWNGNVIVNSDGKMVNIGNPAEYSVVSDRDRVLALEAGKPQINKEAIRRRAIIGNFNRWKRIKMQRIKSMWYWIWILTYLLLLIGWNIFNITFQTDRIIIINAGVFVALFFHKVTPMFLEYYKSNTWYGSAAWFFVVLDFVLCIGVWILLYMKRAWIFFVLWTPLLIASCIIILLLMTAHHEYTKIVASYDAGTRNPETTGRPSISSDNNKERRPNQDRPKQSPARTGPYIDPDNDRR